MTTAKESVSIEMGDLVKDGVTGFEGIVIARTEWLNGCLRFVVQPQGLNKEGKMYDATTFDTEQLEVVKKGAYKPKKSAGAEDTTGGPYPDPIRR